MKLIIAIGFLLLTGYATAQSTFETLKEANGTIIMKGLLSKEVLDKESSFTWMQTNLSSYKPDSTCIARLQQQKDSVYLLVFAGTWCGDTQIILPQLFHLVDKAGFPLSRINLIGVDRMKKTTGTLAESMGVFNVPTIIVMKKGKECGRVVEYGKYGVYDRELGEIMKMTVK